MAISQSLQLKEGQSTLAVASFTTTAMTVTAGNAAVACMSGSATGIVSVTASDSLADAHSNSVSKVRGTGGQMVAIDVFPTLAGGSTTWTVTPDRNSFVSICVTEHSGMHATPKEGTNTGEAASQAVSPGAINPATASDLYVSCWTHDGSGSQTFTAGGGATLRGNQTNTANQPLGSEDFVGSGSQTLSATLSGAANPTWDAAVGTFKAAAGLTTAQTLGIFDQELSGAMVGTIWK